MPTRRRVGAWVVWALVAPAMTAAQGRTEQELVDLIVRDGPQARAIRAGAGVTRRAQLARTAFPNPELAYSREGAGFTEFFNVDQFLPLVGTRAALTRAGVAATAAAEADRDARWLLRAEARAAVARLAAEQERSDAARAASRDIEALIEVLRVREREGEGSRFDRLRAEQELAEARQVVVDADVLGAAARADVAAMIVALADRNALQVRLAFALVLPGRGLRALQVVRTAFRLLEPFERAIQRFA